MELGVVAGGRAYRQSETPDFKEHYDVIVVGLGTAGAEAALAAAKLGLKTLGIEKHNALGGQSTIGCINFGAHIADRMFALENQAEKNGLSLAYHSIPVGVWLSDQEVKGVRICHNGICRDIAAKITIDATGNATIARMAGCRLCSGREWDQEKGGCARAELWTTPEGDIRPIYANYRRDLCGSARSYSSAITFLAGTRHKVWNSFRRRMLKPALLVGAREEERVETLATVTLHDCLTERSYPDPIFYCFGPEDLVRVDSDGAFESKEIQNWKYLCYMPFLGYPAVLPYGTIVAKDVKSLLVPSKHFGVSHDAGGGIRMQGEMLKTGYAAACAALVAIQKGVALESVEYSDLAPLLEKGGNLKRPEKSFVTSVNGEPIGPFTMEQTVAALQQDISLPGEWWNSIANGGPQEQASYALWSCWKCSLTGSDSERQRLRNMLFAEMEKGGRWAGNFAVALGLMDDKRACSMLRSLIETPGELHPTNSDPIITRSYPNRIKALCLLGRLGDQAAIPSLKKIILDSAMSFTKDLMPAKLFHTMDRYRFEVLSYALMSLRQLLQTYPAPDVVESIRGWNSKPLTLISERENLNLAPMLKNIIT